MKVEDLSSKIASPEEAIKKYFPKKGIIAFGGMAGTSYPKAIPKKLSELIQKGEFDASDYVILSGGTETMEFESWISNLKISRKFPLGASSTILRDPVNERKIPAMDYWLYEFSSLISRGVLSRKIGNIDLTIIEATGIDDEGIVPSLSVDATPSFIENSKKVIIELNESKPNLKGFHDIFLPKAGKEIMIKNPLDRIGRIVYNIPFSKIAAIVVTNEEESEKIHYSGITNADLKIVDNIIDFLLKEIKEDENLRSEYFTLQPAAGPVAGALSRKIHELETNIWIWGEVAATSWIETLSRNVKGISASSIYTLPGEQNFRKKLYEEIESLRKYIVIRPYEIANNPQVIARFYHVVVQQAVEVDIYGNANVSHIGPNLMVGVGGSGDHTRPSYITILALQSTTSNEKISRIVPLLRHVDIPEHDVDILVTEQGWVDLRFLSPIERAERIIEKCAHPKFKDDLFEYLGKIKKIKGHEPYEINHALKYWFS